MIQSLTKDGAGLSLPFVAWTTFPLPPLKLARLLIMILIIYLCLLLPYKPVVPHFLFDLKVVETGEFNVQPTSFYVLIVIYKLYKMEYV